MNRSRGAVVVALVGVAAAIATTATVYSQAPMPGYAATHAAAPYVAKAPPTAGSHRHGVTTVRAARRLPSQAMHHGTTETTATATSRRQGTAAAAARRAARRARLARLARMRADPARNVTATPGYSACWTARTSAGCLDLELRAINHARAAEGVKAMVLPRGFTKLSSARQIFVVTNLERTARGLRPLAALVKPLDALASTAAHHDEDPSLASWQVGRAEAWRWVSNWADDINALAADYDYMYNDGYATSGTVNGGCTSQRAPDCWAHRHNILERFPRLPLLLAGVAEVRQGSLESSAIIMVGARGRTPHQVFSWRQVEATGLR